MIAWTWIVAPVSPPPEGDVRLASHCDPRWDSLLLPMFAAAIVEGWGAPWGDRGAIIIGVAQQVSSAFLKPAYGAGVASFVS